VKPETVLRWHRRGWRAYLLRGDQDENSHCLARNAPGY
jgi:hypothetical protein